MKQFLPLLLVLITFPAWLYSQDFEMKQTLRPGSSIVDDSTRQIYGATTTRLFGENTIRFNTVEFHFVDTTITNFDLKFSPLQAADYEAQDLGNPGTAWRSFYYTPPTTIGARSGFDVYQKYYKEPWELDLYDTKSPFSWFSVFWGGSGRSITQAGYSRNVNERSNFTFDYSSFLVDKRVGIERRGDRNTKSFNYSLNSWYRSKNLKYAAIIVLSRMNHTIEEMGSVNVDPDNSSLSDYFLDTAVPSLSNTENSELRRELYYYHRYELNKLISLFHTMRWGLQENTLLVSSSSESANYYDFVEIPYVSEAKDSSNFHYFTNTAGITGYTKGFNYELYAKARKVRFDYAYLETQGTSIETEPLETYLGVNLGTEIDSTFFIRGNAEYQTGGNYRIEGKIKSKLIDGKAGRLQYDPSFIQQGYRGHYDFWSNNFSKIQSTYMEGTLKLRRNGFLLAPTVSYSLIANNVYFKKVSDQEDTQQVLPIQDSRNVSLLSSGARIGRMGAHSYLWLSGKYNLVAGTGAESFPIPQYAAKLDMGLSNSVFDDHLIFQLGIRIHWRSAFYGMNYDPAIQQFYVQNEFEIPDYWFFDLYLNAGIDRAKIFLKFNNMRNLLNATGYFSTPYYPGVPSVLDFGFYWTFYD